MAEKNELNEDIIIRLQKITEVIQSIAGGNFTATAEVTSNANVIDALAAGVNMLAEELEDGTVGLEYINNRIDEIIEVVQKCARGDYESCEISEKNDSFDALCMGINMMIDDIKNSFQKLQETQDATLNILEDLDRRGRELNDLNKQLHQEIHERKRAEKALLKRTHELDERVREISCLYKIANLFETPNIAINELIQEIVNLIPTGWQYPEITEARIIFEGKDYKTKNFKQTKWMQSIKMIVNNKKIGLIEVCYLKKKPKKFEGPFLKEERNLIDDIAKRLSEVVSRKRAEVELKNTLKEVERSNKELEQFAYIASHDLQEPLRMVSSYLQLLERRYKDKLDSEANEFIEFAVDGAKRMKILIDDLLSYSRVTTHGKIFETTDTENVLNQALSNLGLMIEDSGAEVTHESLPLLRADDVQLGQLFQNLVGNAIKFHGEELPKIHVSVDKTKNEWVFSVRDNGIGIDPKFSDQAFMIFQRLQAKEKYPGTGIGLAVCKRIVERHHGKIWFESKPGRGTTFYFTIPMMDKEGG